MAFLSLRSRSHLSRRRSCIPPPLPASCHPVQHAPVKMSSQQKRISRTREDGKRGLGRRCVVLARVLFLGFQSVARGRWESPRQNSSPQTSTKSHAHKNKTTRETEVAIPSILSRLGVSLGRLARTLLSVEGSDGRMATWCSGLCSGVLCTRFEALTGVLEALA